MNNHGRPVLTAAFLLVAFVGSAHSQVQMEWIQRFEGTPGHTGRAVGVVTAPDGSIYVVGSIGPSIHDQDYLTIKYSSEGEQLWWRTYDGPSTEDTAEGLVIDSLGDVYVTGTSRETLGIYHGRTDIATVKYSATGEEQWVHRYDGPGHGVDKGRGIAIDPFDNIYVCGSAYRGVGSSGTSNDDLVILRFNTQGDTIWTRLFDDGANRSNGARALTTDRIGNVFATGVSNHEASSHDFSTVMFSPAGDERWHRSYTSPVYGYDIPEAIGVDSNGDVIVTGSGPDPENATKIITIRYDSTGVEVWSDRFDYLPGSGGVANDLIIDADGATYVTGSSWAPGDPSQKFITLKYNRSGTLMWSSDYFGSGNYVDSGYGLALGLEQQVYAAGLSFGAGTERDYATLRYGPDGQILWAERYDGPIHDRDGALAIATDTEGDIIVTGFSVVDAAEDIEEIVTIKYRDDTPVQAKLYQFTGSIVAEGISLRWTVAEDDETIAYRVMREEIGSYSIPLVTVPIQQRTGSGEFVFVDEHVQPGITYRYQLFALNGSLQDTFLGWTDVSVPEMTFSISAVSPNPARGTADVRVQFSSDQVGKSYVLAVYNVSGRRIALLQVGIAATDPVRASWDGKDRRGNVVGAGVYWLRLTIGDRVHQQKLVRF